MCCRGRDTDHQSWLTLATYNADCGLWATRGVNCPNRVILNTQDNVFEVHHHHHCLTEAPGEKKASKNRSKGNRAAQQARTKEEDRGLSDKYYPGRIEAANPGEEREAAVKKSAKAKRQREIHEEEQ